MTIIAKKRSGTSLYMKLVVEFPLRPLRTQADHRRALGILDRLALRAETALSRDEQDYIQTLAILVEDYEKKHAPTMNAQADPIEVLKHLMEENDMTTSDLGRLLGSKGIASEILNRKRALSKSHMAVLADRFHVDVGLFF